LLGIGSPGLAAVVVTSTLVWLTTPVPWSYQDDDAHREIVLIILGEGAFLAAFRAQRFNDWKLKHVPNGAPSSPGYLRLMRVQLCLISGFFVISGAALIGR
jgi:hypothetical protein